MIATGRHGAKCPKCGIPSEVCATGEGPIEVKHCTCNLIELEGGKEDGNKKNTSKQIGSREKFNCK